MQFMLMINADESACDEEGGAGQSGPFHVMAAIQLAHVRRAWPG